MGDEHALHALDDSDPDHHAGAHGEVAAEGGQCAQFQEWGVWVDQQFDALARGELAAGVMALNVFGPAAGECTGKFGVEFGQFRGHRGGGLQILGRGRLHGAA